MMYTVVTITHNDGSLPSVEASLLVNEELAVKNAAVKYKTIANFNGDIDKLIDFLIENRRIGFGPTSIHIVELY